jgi:hypothetical protein
MVRPGFDLADRNGRRAFRVDAGDVVSRSGG